MAPRRDVAGGNLDLPIAEARRFLRGPIGVSTHDLGQLARAIADGADLVGFGPVFATSTPKYGLQEATRLVQFVRRTRG